MSDEINRTLGKHDAKISTLESDVKEIKDSVRTILAVLSEAKGGWKTLMLVAGVAGTLGAFSTKIGVWLGLLPK